MRYVLCLFALTFLTACGEDSGGGSTPTDAGASDTGVEADGSSTEDTSDTETAQGRAPEEVIAELGWPCESEGGWSYTYTTAVDGRRTLAFDNGTYQGEALYDRKEISFLLPTPLALTNGGDVWIMDLLELGPEIGGDLGPVMAGIRGLDVATPVIPITRWTTTVGYGDDETETPTLPDNPYPLDEDKVTEWGCGWE